MESVTFTRGKQLYVGKAKTIYATNDPDFYEIEFSDWVSAGDGEKRTILPGKGLVNCTISIMLFKLFERSGVPTYYVCPGSNASSMIVNAKDMLKMEIIGRYEAAGSFCKRHPEIPAGAIFGCMLFELTLKDDKLGNPFITEKEAVNVYNLVTEHQLNTIFNYTNVIGACTKKFFQNFGLRLIDFKVEFGLDKKTGNIILCDEFSPDTCRLWDKNGKSYDKDVFRKNLGDVSETYFQLLELIQLK